MYLIEEIFTLVPHKTAHLFVSNQHTLLSQRVVVLLT